jgi:hypothetical protein
MSFLNLTAVQLAHAKRIVAVSKYYVEHTRQASEDYAERAADIALAVALVESELRVYANPRVPGSLELPHDLVGHDHYSVGLFQQQVPMWGKVADCQGVDTSVGLFLHALFRLDWHGHTNGQLAQRVQVSAFPDRYQARDREAITIRKALW